VNGYSDWLLNEQIVDSLGATESTIKKHRARVLEKLGVQSIAELVNTLGLMKHNGLSPIDLIRGSHLDHLMKKNTIFG
jgi:Bacterial regulatory proteins, luxR family